MAWINVWRWILDAGWFIFLLILFRHFWLKRKTLVLAQSWLKAKGYITHCEWTKVGHGIWPKIEYTYQVYNQNRLGESLFLDTTHNNPHSKYSRKIAYKAAIAFNENQEIDVYYNPNHPEESALDVTIPLKLNLILILIALLIVFHLGFIAWRHLE